MNYTMTFALTPDLGSVLLLRKPDNHRNPLFRGRWTAPGGHVETGESEIYSAIREMYEETGLVIAPGAMRGILRFVCNCDPDEDEHEVAVFGTILPTRRLQRARGSEEEPVRLCSKLPEDSLWYLSPLMDLVIGRMNQPHSAGRQPKGGVDA